MSVHRIAHDGASLEGANSTYVLPDRGVVIDPGPPGETAWRTLRDGLGDGCGLDAVDHVLVTHWHIDHAGLAPRLAEAADASLHLHESDAALVGEYDRERKQRLVRDKQRLERWGVPSDIVAAVIDNDRPSPLPASFPTESHTDGEEIAGLRLLHTPGHTLGHAAFHTERALFVGDAVLPTYTPNVGGSDTRVENALATYERTLERLREYDITPYPGHGADVDLSSRIDEIRDHNATRAETIKTVVDDAGPVTPWEIATDLFGEMNGIHAKMGTGEVVAHLSHLESVGDIERVGTTPLRVSLLP
ncbi:MBL fold metallo-hydrolase [Halococcus sp. AFM35]|uniref:MBL fold metallo-hydrolase n=1 Tax=Halococcus sp. AFM35 TaxID=3421653 RepID=UPI003EBBE4A7